MRPGPIFQQLVRLSVAQRGKLGGETVVTSLYLLVPPKYIRYSINTPPRRCRTAARLAADTGSGGGWGGGRVTK